ncbi:MAG: hypothetical protein AAF361_15235, partial [Bacteroidota bacterium]
VTTNTQDGSGFLVPFDDLPTGEIDVTSNLTNGIQLANVRNAGIGFNGAVYHTSNIFGEPGIQKLVLDNTGRFVADGFIPTGAISYGGGSTFGFATTEKGYYTDHSVSQTAIQIFDPVSMMRTGEIDFADAINAIRDNLENKENVETTSMGGFMLERDGKFFTELYFSDENGFEVDDKTFVVVIDIATDSLERIIVWDDHIKIGYFSFKNVNYANIDEKGDIYMSSFIGNFVDPEGPNFRSIRIQKGQTDFDETWDLNGNRGDFPGGENFALGGAVLNGKMYVKMIGVPVDLTFAALAEKEYYAYEIDLATRNATKIEDIPAGFWRSIHGPALYAGKPYFIVENADLSDPNDPNQGKAYYYSYDPATGTSQLEITVIGGQPQNIVEF